MSKTIGRCGRCGYRLAEKETIQSNATPPLPLAEAPIIVRFEASRSLVKEIMADAYRQVALADSDMVPATRILETIRMSLLTEQDGVKIWKILDEAIGDTEVDVLRISLINLRAWFREQLFDQQRIRLNKIFERDSEEGWREWQKTYAEGLSRWRLLLCKNLVDAPFPFPEQFHKPYDFKPATQLILHERWTEVHQFFTFLARQEFLHPYTRARLLIPAGQTYLYYFSPPERALGLFRQAQQLAPELAIVSAVLGDYYKNMNDLTQARTYLEGAMQAAPNEAEAYCFMGNLEDKQGNLEEARKRYLEAISNASGDSQGYNRLLVLYGQPQFIKNYESQILSLAEQAKAIDETGEYRVYLNIGDAYIASLHYETAHQWYDRAIQLEPERLDGYLWKGFAYLAERESRYDAAQRSFEKAIKVAPEAYNGYWGMGQLVERKEKWAEVIQWYEKASQRQPELYSSFQSRIGEMYKKLGDLNKAETAFLDGLKRDNSNDADLLNLADDYKNQGKPEEALRVLNQIREIKGDAFEADYQNQAGNICYDGMEYEKAAQHYQNAIRLRENNAVFVSNLSLAYIGLGNLNKAESLALHALKLDSSTDIAILNVVGEYMKKGKPEEALRVLNQIREIKGAAFEADYQNQVGNICYDGMEYEKAAEHYQNAIRLRENNAVFVSNLSLAYIGLGDLAKAEPLALNALKLDSSTDFAMLNIVDGYKNQGKPEEALRVLNQIREIKGEAFEADYQNEVSNVYYFEKQYEKAAQHGQNAIRLRENNAVFVSNLSLAYIGLGDLNKAEPLALNALKLDSSSDIATINVVGEYRKQGKPEEALRVLNQIREIKGDAFEADYQNQVGNICYDGLEYEKAAQHYQNAIRLREKNAVFVSNLSLAYIGLGDLAKAEPLALDALKLDNSDNIAMLTIADEYKNQGKPEEALRVLNQIREIKGAAFKADS